MQWAAHLLVLLGLATLGATEAAATEPSMPVTTVTADIEGEPTVGNKFRLRLTFDVDEGQDLVVRLHGSPLVDVLAPGEFRIDRHMEGEFQRSWWLRIKGEGFWSLAVSSLTPEGHPTPIFGVCCGNGWSGEGAGAWELAPEGPFPILPPLDAQARVRLEPVGDRMHVGYNVTTAAWLPREAITAMVAPVTHSSRHGGTPVWQRDYEVAVGETLHVTVWSDYRMVFPAPTGLPPIEPGDAGHTWRPQVFEGRVHCQTLRLGNENGTARLVEELPCGLPYPTQPPKSRPAFAAPAASLAAALGFALLLVCRVKG